MGNWAEILSAGVAVSNFPLKDTIQENDTGTPQGGILSPMLANVALTTFDEYCYKSFGEQTYLSKKQGGNYIQNPLVRYADDFVSANQKQKQKVSKGKFHHF